MTTTQEQLDPTAIGNGYRNFICDIAAPEAVEVSIRHDGKVVWVNVDGVCRFRACQIKTLELKDDRAL